jgi:hypothetical protein
MAVTRVVIESVAGVGILGALFFSGCGFTAKQDAPNRPPAGQPIASVPYTIKNAPGNSPVKVVGGSMTFRAKGGWTNVTGNIWKATNTPDTSVIQLERVTYSGNSGQPDTVTIANINVPWQIEVDGRTPDGTAVSSGPNGVIVCVGTISATTCTQSAGNLQIVPIGSALFYGSPALTWDPTNKQYDGLRYKDFTKDSTDATKDCSKAGWFCESIYQIKITLGNGSPMTFLCPDGECRVNIGPPS